MEREAFKLEKWLVENTQHKDFDKEMSRYNGILFSIESKKMFAENLEKGVTIPHAYDLPRRINKS